MTVTVKDCQTLFDIALLAGGCMETAMSIAEANGLSMTDRLADGQQLTIPEPLEYSVPVVVTRYGTLHIEPATETSIDDVISCPYGGIGFMGIGIDFICS